MKTLDFLYSLEMLITLSAGPLLLALMLVTFISSSNPSKVGMILLGLVFVVLGGFAYVYFSTWEWAGAAHVTNGLLSAGALEEFKNYKGLVIYLFPFVSAAIGTNLISDAITKHQLYETPFSFYELLKDIGLTLALPLILIFALIISPLLVCSAFFRRIRRPAFFRLSLLWRWIFLQALKISIIARSHIRCKDRSNSP